MSVIHWPEIELFHNIRKHTSVYPDILNGKSEVSYKCKVKLHGTNAAVQVYQDGRIVAQSRTSELSTTSDNAGFAQWVDSQADLWKKIAADSDEDMIIFGEWAGSGIQKGVAVSNIGKKVFAVFAAKVIGEDSLIKRPCILNELVRGIPDVYVLPWYDMDINIDWSKPAAELADEVAKINEWVEAIEKNDPWVENVFGIKGTGEGLVFYPISNEHIGFKNFGNLAFKAKGEKHKLIKTAAPAQVNPEVAASADAFVDLVLTPARLEQGVGAVGGLDLKLTGKFVGWISADIQKETKGELEASNLTWEQVQKPLYNKARVWYLAEVKK
jgi:hypothetical protein